MNDREVLRAVREACGARGRPYPIEVIDGDAEPLVCGRSHYWTTPNSKTEVRHPNAYGYRCVYHASTLHIRVGRKWLEAAKLLKPKTPHQIITDMAKDI